MAQLKILTVGKLKENYLVQAQAEYLKRLKPYLRLEIQEIPDLPAAAGLSPAQEEQLKQKEGQALLKSLQPKDYLIALDRQGGQLTSEEFAGLLNERLALGEQIVMVIGGSLGLAEEVLSEADLRLSFSKLTLPHQLFRVVLLEQIYRACKIMRGEKYHK